MELNKYNKDNSQFKRSFVYEFNYSIVEPPYEPSESDIAFMKCFFGNNYSSYIHNILWVSNIGLNAYALPNGEIYVGNELLDVIDADELDGIIAHEIAHIVLNHHEVQLYTDKRRYVESQNMQALATAFTALAHAGVSYGSIKSGILTTETAQAYQDLATGTILTINEAIHDNFLKNSFRYSREQEIEADIVACLFLVWQGGYSESYIKALSKIHYQYGLHATGEINSAYNTHPSLAFRINTLKAIFQQGERNFMQQNKTVRKYTDPTYKY
jgi:Zn-dependent protease with chaperone function